MIATRRIPTFGEDMEQPLHKNVEIYDKVADAAAYSYEQALGPKLAFHQCAVCLVLSVPLLPRETKNPSTYYQEKQMLQRNV